MPRRELTPAAGAAVSETTGITRTVVLSTRGVAGRFQGS